MSYCDLCDLAFSQCAHGLEKRQRTLANKAKAKQRKTAAPPKKQNTQKERPLTAKQQGKLPAVLQGVSVVRPQPGPAPKPRRKCVNCGRKPFGRYNVCADCLRAQGGRECLRCGRLFRPPAGSRKAKRCGTCGGKVAYETLTMGAPSLGRRR